MSQEPTNAPELTSAGTRLKIGPVRAAAIPALFSEGPEPEPIRPAQVRWPALASIKRHLTDLVRFPR